VRDGVHLQPRGATRLSPAALHTPIKKPCVKRKVQASLTYSGAGLTKTLLVLMPDNGGTPELPTWDRPFGIRLPSPFPFGAAIPFSASGDSLKPASSGTTLVQRPQLCACGEQYSRKSGIVNHLIRRIVEAQERLPHPPAGRRRRFSGPLHRPRLQKVSPQCGSQTSCRSVGLP